MFHVGRVSSGRSSLLTGIPRKVVVIGGSGFIGKYVAKAYIQDANTKIQLGSRHHRNNEDVRSLGNVLEVGSDITSRSDVLRSCEGASVIVNLVGIMHERPPKYTFENVHHQGARNIALAAKENNAHLIHISAIGADVNSEVPYARTKALGEIAIRETCPDATILRPSIVFGPEDDFFNRFAKLAKFLPFMPVFGGGKSKFQPIYVWDVAMAILHISDHPQKFQGRTFEIGGPTVYTYKEIMKLTLNQAGMRRPIISLPWSVGLVQGFFLEKLPPNLFTITRDQLKLLQKDNIVSEDPNILKLKDLGIDPAPAERILYTYLRKHEITTPNKRTHRPFNTDVEDEIREIKKIREETPKHALDKESEYQKLHTKK
ncbi:13116_t:CDS:2 [Acaulospora morrowiae]|uniref:13116_t:CDS:1 n=1 Tax=Acaulospora morrowiae TaxID=94023 RepID=A0A9N9C5R6_9GLOM|nr:13116_t:CDS:2 [Acaulospora morrowiae]